MFKSIKTMLWATLVVSLSLGFASCSSSDDDSDILGGVKIKRLPTKITEIRERGGTKIWNFEYDAANRVIDINGQKIEYDKNGHISKIGTTEYRYNAEKKIIEERYNPEGEFRLLSYVDKDGFVRALEIGEEYYDSNDIELYDNVRNYLKQIENPFYKTNTFSSFIALLQLQFCLAGHFKTRDSI